MQNIKTISDFLANAGRADFYSQQQLIKYVMSPENKVWTLLTDVTNLFKLAEINDTLAAKMVEFAQVRGLIKNFADIKHLANIAPETVAVLLNYADARFHITSFNQLLQLFNCVEVLKITLPPHSEIRALVRSLSHLKQLSLIRVNMHSNSNLAQLFISYPDIRKQFTSFKQLLEFINNNPSTGQLFIKDNHTIHLMKNANQLNALLEVFSKLNPLWSKNAALEFAHSTKIGKLFKKEKDLLIYLNHLPDQESIQRFIAEHADLAKLLRISNPKTSLLDMEFFQTKKFRIGNPSIPCNLLQYA